MLCILPVTCHGYSLHHLNAESLGCPVSLFYSLFTPRKKYCLSTAIAHHNVKSQEFSLKVALLSLAEWHWCSFNEHLFLQLCFTLELNVPKSVLLIFSTLPLWFLLLELVFLALHFSRPSFLICNQLLSKLCIVSSCITLLRPNFSS